MEIPDGTVLTWVGSYRRTVSEWFSGSSTQDISAQLSANGFIVRGFQLTSGALSVIVDAPVDATIDVETSTGASFDSEDTVRQLIESSIQQATGNNPVTSRISKIQVPSSSPQAPRTGTQVSTAKPVCASGLSGFLSDLVGSCQKQSTPTASGGLLASFGSNTVLYAGLAIFGFIAALALIGYSGALKVRT